MSKKSCFLSGWVTVVSMALCAGKCDSQYGSQEAQAYYTHNPYVLPSYTAEEFEKMLVVKSPEEIGSFRKKLEKRLPQWFSSGTEPTPFALWQNYRKQVLSELEEMGSGRFTHCYNQWGALLQTPNEATEKEAMEAYKQLQADAQAQQILRSFVQKMYNHPEHFTCSEAALAYQSLVYFVEDKKNNVQQLQHLRLKQLHSNLKQWRKDGHPSGVALWNMVQEQHFKQLEKNAVLFQYPQNRQAIEESLKSIDQLAHDPYRLTHAEWQTTIPHGLAQLDAILTEASLKETGVVKKLKLYRNLIKL